MLFFFEGVIPRDKRTADRSARAIFSRRNRARSFARAAELPTLSLFNHRPLYNSSSV